MGCWPAGRSGSRTWPTAWVRCCRISPGHPGPGLRRPGLGRRSGPGRRPGHRPHRPSCRSSSGGGRAWRCRVRLLAELFDRLSPARPGLAGPGLGLPGADRPGRAAAAGRPVQPGRADQPAGRVPGHRPADRGPRGRARRSVSVHPWTATEVQAVAAGPGSRGRAGRRPPPGGRVLALAAETSWPQDEHAQREEPVTTCYQGQRGWSGHLQRGEGRHRAVRDVPMGRLQRRLARTRWPTVAVAVTAILTAEFQRCPVPTDRLTSLVTTTSGVPTGAARPGRPPALRPRPGSPDTGSGRGQHRGLRPGHVQPCSRPTEYPAGTCSCCGRARLTRSAPT